MSEGAPQATQLYHAGVCALCLSPPSPTPALPLLRCSRCKATRYCSKVCQKKHWSKHKAVCTSLFNVNKGKFIYSEAKTMFAEGKSWIEIKALEKLSYNFDKVAIETKASKKADSKYINELFDFPRVCNICKDGDQENLADCPKCHSVFYCCSSHKDEDSEEHSKHCINYLLSLECDRYELNNGGTMLDLPFPSNIDTKYVKLPDRLMTLLKVQFQIDQGRELRNPDPALITLITQRLSYPLSLLYSLQNELFGSESKAIEDVESLRIHVVGAKSEVELLGIIKWEYFAHRLPMLKKLHVTFIGNELLYSEDDYVQGEDHVVDDSGFTLCDQCKTDRVIVYELVNKLYQNYVEADYYQPPDVIIAYNCGFHEEGSGWDEAFQHLLSSPSVPLVFTSYTQSEAVKDLECVKRHCDVNVVLETCLNPFRSSRSYRDPEGLDSPLFTWNNYITVVKKV